MNTIKDLLEQAPHLESLLDYEFSNKDLLALAFVHRSFINESREVTEHNERLEFLGDSVLGLIVAHWLYDTFPNVPEGELSSMRARLVEASSCIQYAEKLEIESFVLLGRGEKMNSGRGRETIISDLFEAIIGAIYIDGGLEAAKQFLFTHFTSSFEEILKTPDKNWKALLQDLCQKQLQEAPIYQVMKEEGPDHGKTFEVGVFILDKQVGLGKGSSKKVAQQNAAKDALSSLFKGGPPHVNN